MSTLQQEVAEWAQSVFGDSTPQAKILHLWEELGEALDSADAILDYQTCEEIAGAGLITLHLASSLNVILPEPSRRFGAEMRDKFEICKARKWGEPDTNGVVRHIKEMEANQP